MAWGFWLACWAHARPCACCCLLLGCGVLWSLSGDACKSSRELASSPATTHVRTHTQTHLSSTVDGVRLPARVKGGGGGRRPRVSGGEGQRGPTREQAPSRTPHSPPRRAHEGIEHQGVTHGPLAHECGGCKQQHASKLETGRAGTACCPPCPSTHISSLMSAFLMTAFCGWWGRVGQGGVRGPACARFWTCGSGGACTCAMCACGRTTARVCMHAAHHACWCGMGGEQRMGGSPYGAWHANPPAWGSPWLRSCCCSAEGRAFSHSSGDSLNSKRVWARGLQSLSHCPRTSRAQRARRAHTNTTFLPQPQHIGPPSSKHSQARQWKDKRGPRCVDRARSNSMLLLSHGGGVALQQSARGCSSSSSSRSCSSRSIGCRGVASPVPLLGGWACRPALLASSQPQGVVCVCDLRVVLGVGGWRGAELLHRV